ncbi:MAG: TrkA-C domain protein, partial [Planctomycetota bacterium]|nr:TrkA-C domain protein [Planctomycetota bacterium]
MLETLIPILGLLIIITVSMICVKIGSVALRMTGMSQESASFQSLSAFTGTGFTTKEAETITKDRRRRKIAKALMIAGNAGMAVAIAAVFQSFQKLSADSGDTTIAAGKVALAAFFLFSTLIIYRLAIANWVNRWLSRFIEKRLAQVTDLAMPHFERVLQLGKGYGISEIHIRDGHPATGKTLQDLAWGSRGVLVLAIERGTKLI